MREGLILSTLVLLLVALPPTINALQCFGRPCVGPVQVLWEGFHCNGTITTVLEMAPVGTAGTCANTTVSTPSSSKFECSAEILEITAYGGTDHCEAGYYHAKISSPIARCVNVASVGPNADSSYAYFCLASDYETTTIAPSFAGTPNGVPPHPMADPCPNSGCATGIATQKKYTDSQCSGFELMEKSMGVMDTCVLGFGGTSSMRYSCGADYLRFYYHPYGCDQPYTEVSEESRSFSHCLFASNYLGEISCDPVISLPPISFSPSSSPVAGTPSSNPPTAGPPSSNPPASNPPTSNPPTSSSPSSDAQIPQFSILFFLALAIAMILSQ